MWQIANWLLRRRLFLVVAALGLAARPAVADDAATGIAKKATDRTAAQLLGADTVVYAEIARPSELVDGILNHPLRGRVEGLDAYRAALFSKEYLQFQFGLGVAQTALGMKWDEALEVLAGGGIYFGFDPASQGVVVLVRSQDAERLAKIRDRLFEFARADARGKKRPDPIKETTHRGAAAYQFGEGYAATLGPWLLVTNRADAGKAAIDRLLDADAKSLAGSADFRAAQGSLAGKPAAWAYVNVKALRDYGMLAAILRDKSENPGVELLAGGLLSTLAKTPSATAALFVSDEGARLVVGAPHDPTWVAKPREFYFGSGGKGEAPPPLVPAGEVALSLVTHRDLAGMWLAAAELFDEKANAELSKAESGLSTLFGGKDFGRDILGAFGPQVQLLVARQDFAKTTAATPDIKLPAGAIVLRMKDPAKTQQQLKVTFQSVIGFLNIVGGMNGYPPLDLNTERRGKDLIVSSEYMMEADAKTTGGKMFHNFSPSIAMVGDRFIIASTKSLAESLADAAKRPSGATEKSASGVAKNTGLEVNAAVAAKLLDDNRAQLVAQNMLEKGHDKKAAEAEIRVLTDLVSWFDSASLRLTTPKDRVELELAIDFAPTKK